MIRKQCWEICFDHDELKLEELLSEVRKAYIYTRLTVWRQLNYVDLSSSKHQENH